jgi:hypothetical protein
MFTKLVLGALCILPWATAFSFGPSLNLVKVQRAQIACSPLQMRSAVPSRREALGVLAGAGAMLIGQKQAVARDKDIAGGGLPGGLQEFFGLMQTKKQVDYTYPHSEREHSGANHT